MAFTAYPLKFYPILKERIWGGQKLAKLLNKGLSGNQIGESWEISTVANDVSIIMHGEYASESLSELISKFPKEVLGTHVHDKFGQQFPLLFKFIDAMDDLSIQVHPNDALAKARHNSFGKTEMWYVLQADADAKIIVGFKEKSAPEEYVKHLHDKSLLSILNQTAAAPGDAFFLETGTIHAIRGGILLAEIQQTSDITYRVYDWDRVDGDGKSRELHVDLALDAITFDKTDSRRHYQKEANSANTIVDCQYFTTNFISLSREMTFSKRGNSFTVLMCVDGEYTLYHKSCTYRFVKGESILIPAAMRNYSINGNATILEIYIS